MELTNVHFICFVQSHQVDFETDEEWGIWTKNWMKTLVQRMPVPTRVPIAGNRGGNARAQMELSARQPRFENASTAGYESVVSTQPEDEGYPQ
jgi:hypothetical protein